MAKIINCKHGNARKGSVTKEYRTFHAMLNRCYNKKNKSYKDYGERGIHVCKEWRASFATFLSDMGAAPSARHSIDRIDNTKGYAPNNCRWALPAEQAANRSVTVRVHGKTLQELAKEHGIKASLLKSRYYQEEDHSIANLTRPLENNLDAARAAYTRLHKADVIEIYTSKRSIAELAVKFSIGIGHIKNIRCGHRWRSVTKGVRR